MSKAVFSEIEVMRKCCEVRGVAKAVRYLVLGLLLCVSGVVGYWFIFGGGGSFFKWGAEVKKLEPDPERYEVLVKDLRRWREDLARRHKAAGTATAREEVEKEARVILESFLPDMMRCWLGTSYDFNGIAEKPGGGGIACGYFVSTILRDAGFRVNRYKLAQQPSGNIMRSFVGKEGCELRVGVNYEEYVDWLEEKDQGIYLMGLDSHVGFVVNVGDGMRFLHSSGIDAAGVVDEGRGDAQSIRWSKWRMLGKFSGDQGVIRTWLKGEEVKVVGE